MLTEVVQLEWFATAYCPTCKYEESVSTGGEPGPCTVCGLPRFWAENPSLSRKTEATSPRYYDDEAPGALRAYLQIERELGKLDDDDVNADAWRDALDILWNNLSPAEQQMLDSRGYVNK